MSIYHVVVIAIVAVALIVPRYVHPGRSAFFKFLAGLLIALFLTGILMLSMYVYFAARGEL